MNKILIFEYLVFRLNEWKLILEKENVNVPAFTKLRLQKILFLVCAWKATGANERLLSVFNNFYALPYGPVEMDIYEAMKNRSFQHICFEGNICICDSLMSTMFADVSNEHKLYVDETIKYFMKSHFKYLSMPVFDLVELTHKWPVWQIAMQYAKLLGHNKARITSSDIIESKKSYD